MCMISNLCIPILSLPSLSVNNGHFHLNLEYSLSSQTILLTVDTNYQSKLYAHLAIQSSTFSLYMNRQGFLLYSAVIEKMSFKLNFCLLLLGVMYIHVAAGEWENDEAGQPKDNEGDDIRPRHLGNRGPPHGPPHWPRHGRG